MEALVETCPVGVAVFDAATGAPLSFNRKARRIVEGLEIADTSVDRLREVAVCWRSDGREATLRDLAHADTVRAEEVEISAPGGKASGR